MAAIIERQCYLFRNNTSKRDLIEVTDKLYNFIYDAVSEKLPLAEIKKEKIMWFLKGHFKEMKYTSGKGPVKLRMLICNIDIKSNSAEVHIKFPLEGAEPWKVYVVIGHILEQLEVTYNNSLQPRTSGYLSIRVPMLEKVVELPRELGKRARYALKSEIERKEMVVNI